MLLKRIQGSSLKGCDTAGKNALQRTIAVDAGGDRVSEHVAKPISPPRPAFAATADFSVDAGGDRVWEHAL